MLSIEKGKKKELPIHTLSSMLIIIIFLGLLRGDRVGRLFKSTFTLVHDLPTSVNGRVISLIC